MKTLFKVLFLFGGLCSVAWTSLKSQNLLAVTLSMNKKKITEYKDTRISVEVKSLVNQNVLIPKQMRWGFIEDSLGFVLIQVQKKDNGVYKNMPPVGSLTFVGNDELDTIAPFKTKYFLERIGLLYDINEKGIYRLRVLCLFSSLNENIPNVYSNWCYFRSNGRIKFPPDGTILD